MARLTFAHEARFRFRISAAISGGYNELCYIAPVVELTPLNPYRSNRECGGTSQ
jgi:hypothetical protein